MPVLAAVLALVAALLLAAPAAADGPGVGAPAVVTLGDSAISGEAGRWAGNTNQSSTRVDALGSRAYWDAPTGEAIPGCHRSRAAQAHIGDGVLSANLACSGARTSTTGTGSGQTFKPGIDFYSDAQGRKGQALMLQEYAASHNVKAVVVMIGANNYGFGAITATRRAQETENVRQALLRVATAMQRAGYQPPQYTIVGQTYWSPVPRGADNRYPESGWTRQSIGGCGTWNRDLNWANDTVMPAMNATMRDALARSGLGNTALLDMENALDGRRLCERGVGVLEEVGVASWQSAGAVDRTEWVSQIRTATTIVGPYQLQEGSHASYWGQLAMRNCLRQAFGGGTAVRGGHCVRAANGLTARGEPQMTLAP